MKTTIETRTVGPFLAEVDSESPWTLAWATHVEEDGAEIATLTMEAPGACAPPPLGIYFEIPLDGIRMRWSASDDLGYLPANWEAALRTNIGRGLPLYALVDSDDKSRLTFAISEVRRSVDVRLGVREANSLVSCSISFFPGGEAPLKRYRVSFRFDRRGLSFDDSIRDASAWLSSLDGVAPCTPPPAAFDPLYSSWYGFHKDFRAEEIEAECAAAASLGMKVLILDDGWQEDKPHRAYSYCGDWEPIGRKIPDMRAHVAKIHELGLKYVLWFSVPFIGKSSAFYERFRGKYVRLLDGLDAAVLDPRFPEVRDFLASTYERALRDWDIDGFKLDFIDRMAIDEDDPAIAENFAGRDVRSLPEAIDVLLAEVMGRLKAIKPDLLVEFRQPYVGPAIRKCGNMLRASDCPANIRANRIRTVNLRLTSGATAVHSDMLEWHVGETAEEAAQQILSVLFSVIQYSMRIERLPGSHREMIRHWVAFTQTHREALLEGTLRPRSPMAGYPVVVGEGKAESVYAVYEKTALCEVRGTKPSVVIVNATSADSLCVDFPVVPLSLDSFDTFGHPAGSRPLAAGLRRIAVPRSGYLVARFA